jgi:hypothetical protein
MQTAKMSSSDGRLDAAGYPPREAQPAQACTVVLLWLGMAAILAISVFVRLSCQINGGRQDFG